MKKTLHLTLSKEPFDIMVTGEKTYEYRVDSSWIISRLYNKDNTLKEYDEVKFVNGYGSDKPYFICEFLGFSVVESPEVHTYSNGFTHNVPIGTYKISLGEIIESGNLK